VIAETKNVLVLRKVPAVLHSLDNSRRRFCFPSFVSYWQRSYRRVGFATFFRTS